MKFSHNVMKYSFGPVRHLNMLRFEGDSEVSLGLPEFKRCERNKTGVRWRDKTF